MVKKLVLHISSVNDDCLDQIQHLLHTNNALLEVATAYKNKITEHYQNKSWDKYKKLSNEYELIFFSSNSSNNIASITPVSRSFFKLWEILYDFDEEIGVSSISPMKCVFLAEGPGGFFEAFHRKRALQNNVYDDCHGITLKSLNKSVPDWKTNKRLPLKISYGKDGTGDLYNVENITTFADTVGNGDVDFITADGGFDFSSDFNNQEEQSFRLIVSEVLCALMLQKRGGKFLLKVYDCFNEETLKMLHILKMFYTDIYLIKPLTSRPANSERYVLCTGFSRDEGPYEKTIQLLQSMVSQYTNIDIKEALDAIPFNASFLSNIVMYNLYYTMRQVYYIQRTINYITFFSNASNESYTTIESALLSKHKSRSVKWCQKYRIPYKDTVYKHSTFLH